MTLHGDIGGDCIVIKPKAAANLAIEVVNTIKSELPLELLEFRN